MLKKTELQKLCLMYGIVFVYGMSKTPFIKPILIKINIDSNGLFNINECLKKGDINKLYKYISELNYFQDNKNKALWINNDRK